MVLVGHSYSNLVISGVVEQAAERFGHPLYLDAFVLSDGQALSDFITPEIYALFHELARLEGNGYGIPPLPCTFGVTSEDDLAWARPRSGPHPLRTRFDPVRLSNLLASEIPRTDIYCADLAVPPGVSRPFTPFARRLLADPAWHYVELATGHSAMIAEPAQMSRLLLDLAV